MKIFRFLLLAVVLLVGTSPLVAQVLPPALPSQLDLPVSPVWKWLPDLMKSSGHKIWMPMTAFNDAQVVGALRIIRRNGDIWSDSGLLVPYDQPLRLLVPQFRGNAAITGPLQDWRGSTVASFASMPVWDVSRLASRFKATPLAGMPVGSVLWDRGDQSLYFVVSHLGTVSCLTSDGRELWRVVSPGTLMSPRGLSQLTEPQSADRKALPGGPLVLFRSSTQRSMLLICLAGELSAAWCLDVTNPERPTFRWYREDLPDRPTPLLWGQASWSGEKMPGAFPLAPLVVGQRIYVASQSESGALIEIDPLNGDSRICCVIPNRLATSPVALLDKNQKIQALFFCDEKGRFYRCQLVNNRWNVELLQDLFSVASFDGVVDRQLQVLQRRDGRMSFIVTAQRDSGTTLWSIDSQHLRDNRWSGEVATTGNWWKNLEGTSTGRPLLWRGRLLISQRLGQHTTLLSLSLDRNEPLLHLKSSETPVLMVRSDGEILVLTRNEDDSVLKTEPLKTPLQSGRVIRRYWRRLGRSE